VHDVTNPVITCPAAITIDCEDDNTPAGTGTATATDICTPVGNIAITFSDASTYNADASNVLHYNYVITRTWRATDVAGNFSQCIQTITVHDVTNPVIACPAAVTIDCEDDSTPAATGTATATDICTPVANIAITFSDASTFSADASNVLHYNYVITRTWRATDVAGNFSECIQTITVHDITNPVIACPAPVTIDCEDDNTPAATGTATATDICTPVANIAITFSDASTYSADPSSVLHYNYIISRTWRATDVAGNFSQCIQTITVQDVTNPGITCPADVTLDCEDDNTPTGTGTATATDNCAPPSNIAITFSDISTYSADASNVLHYNYVITRTWRATDVAGNFSQCIQTITVHDITNPVIVCPADLTIDCEDDSTPAATGTATSTDICTPIANIAITFSDVSTYSADAASVLHYN
jgi:chitodextrinase